MNNTRLYPSFLLAGAIALILFTAARAEDDETSTIKFSDPAKPGTLKLVLGNSDIEVHGADAAAVTVRTELKPERPEQRKDGLRVLTSSSSYSLTEKDNVVTLSYGVNSWGGHGGNFDLTVPRNTNVVVSNAFGGDIQIGDVTGDIEVKSLNGEVHLSNVAGGALVETMNGEIHCSVHEIHDGKPLSFTTMNGVVNLNLPAEIKANVSLRTHNGSILTDFDDKQLVTKTASLRSEGGHHGHRALSDSDAAQIRVQVQHAVRVGVEAAREAARAARDAMRDSKDGAESADSDNDEPDVVAPVAPLPPLPPMTGGKIVTGTLNGGGPEIRVTTMNGDVTLRKSEPGK